MLQVVPDTTWSLLMQARESISAFSVARSEETQLEADRSMILLSMKNRAHVRVFGEELRNWNKMTTIKLEEERHHIDAGYYNVFSLQSH